MFEIYRSGFFKLEFRWRFRATNGRIIYGSSESYHNRSDCINSIPTVKDVERADIVDLTLSKTRAREVVGEYHGQPTNIKD